MTAFLQLWDNPLKGSAQKPEKPGTLSLQQQTKTAMSTIKAAEKQGHKGASPYRSFSLSWFLIWLQTGDTLILVYF